MCWFQRSRGKCVLRDIKLEETGEVTAKWRMIGDIKLPWSPRIDIGGRTKYSPGKDGRIKSYSEQWDIDAGEALAQLVQPRKEAVDHWPMQLEGAPPPEPAVVFEKKPVVLLPGFGNDAKDYAASWLETGVCLCVETRPAFFEVFGLSTPLLLMFGGVPETALHVFYLKFILLLSSCCFQDASLQLREPLGQDITVGLRSCLERRGLLTSVVPVKRSDWLRVFVGILLDDDARAGNGTARGAYGWYLDLTKTAIEDSFAATGQAAILIGHSAGGWLGRAVLEREGLDSWLTLVERRLTAARYGRKYGFAAKSLVRPLKVQV